VNNIRARLTEYIRAKGIAPDEHGFICCPWHDDNHPSCKVNEKYLHCFSCGGSGDIFDVAAAILGVPPDREHFREICADIETTLGIAVAWSPPRRRPGEPRTTRKLSQSATYRDLLLRDFAAALDSGDLDRAYYKAALLFALFMLPEGEPVMVPQKQRDLQDRIAAYSAVPR
jgi:hypothetical protein